MQGQPVVFFLALSAIALGLFPGAPRAHAAAPKAETLVNQAVELRRSGDDQGALSLLQQAYGLGHAPRAAGQLGLCEQALGQWADAEAHLLEALKADADAWVKKSRHVLEDALVVVKSHIARVEVQGEPEGAEVLVNGIIVGKLPLAAPVRVAAGELELELRAPGYARETKTMRLEAGQYQRVVLRASRQAATPPPAPASTPVVIPAPAPVAPSVEKSESGTAPAPASSGGGSGLVVARWVALGLGAAALGVGVYGALQHSDRLATFDKTCAIDAMGRAVDDMGRATPDCATKKSAYESKAHLSIGGFVAGGALVAAGVVLWLVAPRAASTETAGLTCAPDLIAQRGAAVACALRF